MQTPMIRVKTLRGWALSAGIGAMIGTAAFAQSPPLDPIARAKAMRAVADQKAESDIKEVIRDAEQAALNSPAVAVQRLKRAMVSLDLSAAISTEKRQELITRLQQSITAIERPATRPAMDPKGPQQKEALRKVFEGYVQEAKEVKDGIAEVEKAEAARNFTGAAAKIADLSRKYPDNPAIIALRSKGTFGDRAADARLLAQQQDASVVYALNSVQRSALMPTTETVEFPKDWAKMVSKRGDNDITIGPDEQALLEALEKRVTNPLQNSPFLETVQTLSNLIGKEIYIDRKSLEDAGLDLQRPVNMPGAVSARTALRAVLQAQGLTFVIKEKLIQVVTIEKARDLQVTRAYYLGELVSGSGPFAGGAVVWGPFIDFQQTMANARIIMDSIQQSIDPLIWRDKGGPATITFHYPSLSIIVRAPAEVHASFKGKLSGR